MRWLTAGSRELAASSDPARSAGRLEELLASMVPDTSGPDRILGLLEEAGERLADRRTTPGHLTASAVVVDAERRRSLVLMHSKLGRWLQPGGHADEDHELAGVALREATEETGIEGLAVMVPAIGAQVHEVDHGDALGAHLHLDVRFLVAAPPGAVVSGNHESTDLRWVSVCELRELVDDDGLVRLVEDGLAVARGAPPPPSGWLG
jgi:8-oxo-dGTP pyrophosphatase MutT (NUDIX family)